MYTLNEYLPTFVGDDLPEKSWDTGMYCLETDAVKVLRSNLQHGFVACFAFVVVDKGWMTIYYNGRELTLHPNALYTYSPGLPVDVIATSDDFHGYCLMADEHVTIEAPSVHDLVHLAYLPIVQLHEPKQTLAADAAQHLIAKMQEIISYIHSDHIYKGEVLRMLYSIFLLDLLTSAMHHPKTLIGQALLHQTIVIGCSICCTLILCHSRQGFPSPNQGVRSEVMPFPMFHVCHSCASHPPYDM